MNALTLCGSTPLMYAVRNKNPPSVVLLLLQHGADPNAIIKNNESSPYYGFTALHFCVMDKQEESARLLVRFGANITSNSTKTKKSPLDIASTEMRVTILKERDIRQKKQQALAAISSVKPSSSSMLGLIKQKSSRSFMITTRSAKILSETNQNERKESNKSISTSQSSIVEDEDL